MIHYRTQMLKRIFVILAAAATVLSCKSNRVESRPVVQFVKDILSDKNAPERAVLDFYQGRSSDISIIGPEERARDIADAFIYCDGQENVTGSYTPDGLRDFAGEKLCVINDDFALKDNEFRTHAVKTFLSALDTTFSLSPYDLEGLGTKASSKIVIFTEAEYVAYAKSDVDTLIHSIGARVRCLTPVESMFDAAAEALGKVPSCIGVISAGSSRKVYEDAFNEICGPLGTEITVYDCGDEVNVLRSFLDRYIESGHVKPLDVILVDDLGADISSMKEEFAAVSSVMNEEYITYAKYLNENFTVIGAAEALTSRCYKILRNDNLFTHNIAMPQAAVYTTVPRPDAQDGEFLLVQRNTYVQD